MREIGLLFSILLLAIAPLELRAAGLAFHESFDGETAFPTTAEIDSFGLLGPFVNNIGTGPPTFSGTGLIHAFSTNGFDITFHTVGFGMPESALATMSTSESDIVLRGRFNVQAYSGIGTSSIGLGAALAPADHRISAGVIFSTLGGQTTASLSVSEVQGPLLTMVASDSVALPPETVTALLTGASLDLEVRFDATTQTTTAWLSVGGSTFETDSIALVAPLGQTLSGFIESVGSVPEGLSITTFTAELQDLQLEVDSASFVPFLNLDIGTTQGVPAATFGGAGFAGTWNPLGLGGPQALVNTSGGATAMTADVFAVTVSQSTSGAGPLKGDRLTHCGISNWRVDLANLPDGAYRVLVYAPADGSPTHDMDIEGTNVLSLPGEPGTALTEGVSWDWALAAVEGGNLTIEEMPGGVCNSGLAGIQLESVPEPNMTALLVAGTLALTLGVRWKRHRSF